MSKWVMCIILAICAGVLLGYFVSIYVVTILTMILACFAFSQVKPAPGVRRGSGHLGAILLGGPISICFLLSMWITWFVTPGGDVGFEVKPMLDFLRHFLLK